MMVMYNSINQPNYVRFEKGIAMQKQFHNWR